MLKYDKEDPIFQKLILGPHPMPGLWNFYLPKELVKFEMPKERGATCMNCPKVREENWRQDYRCCTYHPRVPNFSLGLALFTPEGHKAVIRSLELGVLTPEGMSHSPAQYADYLADLEDEKFGMSQRVLCPMLDRATGFCDIHSFRNSVCSTFFCTNDHGKNGEKFWSSLQTLVGQVEIALSQWCLEELGFNLSSYVKRLNHLAQSVSKISNPRTHGIQKSALKKIWGGLYGRELSTYMQCAELISSHRSILWEIACDTKIRDAEVFEKSVLENVPQNLQHQIDDEEREIGGEASPPQDLWAQVVKDYFKLWRLPTHQVVLNGRVEIVKNPLVNASDKVYQHQPFKLHMRMRKGGKSDDFVLYLSLSEERILRFFSKPQLLTWTFLKSDLAEAHDNAKHFLMEVYSKNILTRPRPTF